MLIMDIRRLQSFCARQDADEPGRVVNEHRQMLRADADCRSAVFEREQRRYIGVALTEKTGRLGHDIHGIRRLNLQR